MKKGEMIISLALAVLVMGLFLMAQRKWQAPSLEQAASSAEQFIKTRLRGALPEIPGYDRIRVFDIDRELRAVLYRSNAVTLGFAPGQLILYNREEQPVFKLQTLEGAREAWTAIYDFSGRRGLPVAGGRSRPLFLRDLSGNGKPDLIIGQYSGGNRCCTTATILELDKESLKTIGRIEGLDGWPFEGLDVRRIGPDPVWELVAHRPATTACGVRDDAADVLAVYAYGNGAYEDQTAKFSDYLQGVLRGDLARWSREKNPSLRLLQTLAALYAETGQPDRAKKFFVESLARYIPDMKQQGIDPRGCLDNLNSLVDRLANPQS